MTAPRWTGGPLQRGQALGADLQPGDVIAVPRAPYRLRIDEIGNRYDLPVVGVGRVLFVTQLGPAGHPAAGTCRQLPLPDTAVVTLTPPAEEPP